MNYIELVKAHPPESPDEGKSYWLRLSRIVKKKSDTIRRTTWRQWKRAYKQGASVENIFNMFGREDVRKDDEVVFDKDRHVVSYKSAEFLTAETLAERMLGSDWNKKFDIAGEAKAWTTWQKNDDDKPVPVFNEHAKVKFVPKTFTPEEILENLQELIEQYKPPKWEPKKYVDLNEDMCAEISLYDAHIDKLAIKLLSNDESTLPEAIQIFEDSFCHLLAQAASYRPQQIIIPFGNDFFNTNGTGITTKKGTVLDDSIFPQQSFMKGVELMRRCIDRAREVAPVKVIFVPGNHDWDSGWQAAMCLFYIYEQCKEVNVDIVPQQLKAFQWGINMLAFGHGDKEKPDNMAAIVANRFPKMWGQTKYRELHCGHTHKERTIEKPGILIRYLRAMSPKGAFLHNHYYGYGKRACYLFVYSKERGKIGSAERVVL